MNKYTILSILITITTVCSSQAFDFFQDFEKEMERMHDRMEKMERAMNEIFEEDFSIFKSKKAATISIDQQDNFVVISSELPGLEDVEANIDDEEETLRVIGKKDGSTVVDILVQKNVVYSSIGYEYTHETKGKDDKETKHRAHYYADFASSLPTQVDVSNINEIKVKYSNELLSITIPTARKTIHRVNVDIERNKKKSEPKTDVNEIDQDIKEITKELAS